MMFWNHGWAMGWMGLWFALWLIVILGGLWLAARFTWAHEGRGAESPEQILKRRYASGELDHDEYERRLTDIRK